MRNDMLAICHRRLSEAEQRRAASDVDPLAEFGRHVASELRGIDARHHNTLKRLIGEMFHLARCNILHPEAVIKNGP